MLRSRDPLSITSSAALDVATACAADLEVELDELRTTEAAGWGLLSARVERQSANVVNPGADERGVMHAPCCVQLAQAVRRDLERLREEVGVNASLAANESADDGGPLPTLLGVGKQRPFSPAEPDRGTEASGRQFDPRRTSRRISRSRDLAGSPRVASAATPRRRSRNRLTRTVVGRGGGI